MGIFKAIIDSFSGPAGLFMWLMLLSVFPLLGGVPVPLFLMKNLKGVVISLLIALVPLVIGAAGCLFSLAMVQDAIAQVPAGQKEAALQTGVEISLGPLWAGILLTAVFLIPGVIGFLVILYLQKDTASVNLPPQQGSKSHE